MGKDDVEITSEQVNGSLILKPQGDIDLSRSPSLRVQIAEAQGSAPSKLIIDLCEVPYMDSSGVATLIEAMKEARQAGRKLVLCALQDRVKSIFEIARLDMVFTIVDTRDDALQA
jgi:anti-sigma B factor antagonist